VSQTWLSPVTYTVGSNTSTVYYQSYSSNRTTATWTVEPVTQELPLTIDDPCPDCTDGSVLVDGEPYACPACDGTGMTWHFASEDEDL
jgi:hypothetical protein